MDQKSVQCQEIRRARRCANRSWTDELVWNHWQSATLENNSDDTVFELNIGRNIIYIHEGIHGVPIKINSRCWYWRHFQDLRNRSLILSNSSSRTTIYLKTAFESRRLAKGEHILTKFWWKTCLPILYLWMRHVRWEIWLKTMVLHEKLNSWKASWIFIELNVLKLNHWKGFAQRVWSLLIWQPTSLIPSYIRPIYRQKLRDIADLFLPLNVHRKKSVSDFKLCTVGRWAFEAISEVAIWTRLFSLRDPFSHSFRKTLKSNSQY